LPEERMAMPADYNSLSSEGRKGFQVWAFPASLAVTEGILVGFFSSA